MIRNSLCKLKGKIQNSVVIQKFTQHYRNFTAQQKITINCVYNSAADLQFRLDFQVKYRQMQKLPIFLQIKKVAIYI